jgi:hypothetical protein
LLRRIKILLFSVLIVSSGCGLFSTRDVEPPIISRSSFIPPTAPDIVLVNFISAITEKNADNYMKCFVDTAYSPKRFIYTADITSQLQYPIFRYWNLSYENQYFLNLRSQTDPSATSSLFLTPENITPTIDSVVYDYIYLLRFDHNKPSVAKTVKGKLRFVISSDNRSLWAINTWIDYKQNDIDTTWSVMKANFSN